MRENALAAGAPAKPTLKYWETFRPLKSVTAREQEILQECFLEDFGGKKGKIHK